MNYYFTLNAFPFSYLNFYWRGVYMGLFKNGMDNFPCEILLATSSGLAISLLLLTSSIT